MSPLHRDNFARAFAEFNQLLLRYQQIWRPQPFSCDILPWQQYYPSLHESLQSLTDEQLDCLENEDLLLAWMADYIPDLEQINAWHIALFEGPLQPMAKFADTGIPGRKKQQIIAFSSAVCHQREISGPIVDWCSGKGHLARQLHDISGHAVTCLEYDNKLCIDGAALSAARHSKVHFIEQDVLQAIAPEIITGAALQTALHACGDLHVQMLITATQTGSAHIACAPCCYQLTRARLYQAMSTGGRLSTLQLSKADLRLAVLQTVTGGQRVRRLRQQELVWRIAYDILQRQVTGVDQYRSTPSINKQYLSGSFIDYATMMAGKTGMSLPRALDEENLLTRAEQKYRSIIRLEKARLAFRRALEYWLLLDRVLYVQEQGYDVQLCSFCPEQVSPRNSLILASKK